MKTHQKTILLIASFCMVVSFSACKRTVEKAETASIDFEVELLGTYKYVGPDTLPNPKCTDSLNVWRAIVEARGTSNVFGDITAYFDFCGDAESNYGNSYSYLLSEPGDTLFFSVEGQVIEGKLDTHPEFVTSFWKEPFEITGGTGKYEGATGSGTCDDYNSSQDKNSHHRWKGTIILVK